MYNGGTATLIDCTISGNSADDGGGVYKLGAATLTDCTISGNSANEAAAACGTTARRRSPIVRSAATPPTKAAASILLGGANSRTTIVDTIVAGNTAITGPDFFGAVTTDQGYNLIGDGDGAGGFTAAGDQVGTAASPIDPVLAPLGDYGGPTQTMALRAGSPAIGQGVAVAGITTDQRGFALDSPRPDIGAQFQTNPLVVNTTSDATGSPPGDLEPAAGGQPGRRAWTAPRRSPSTRLSSRPIRRSP